MFRLATRSAVQLGGRRLVSTAGPNGRSRAYTMMGVVSGVGAVGAAVVLTNPDLLGARSSGSLAACAGQRAGSINVRIVSYNVLSDSLCSSGCECRVLVCVCACVCVCVCV